MNNEKLLKFCFIGTLFNLGLSAVIVYTQNGINNKQLNAKNGIIKWGLDVQDKIANLEEQVSEIKSESFEE